MHLALNKGKENKTNPLMTRFHRCLDLCSFLLQVCGKYRERAAFSRKTKIFLCISISLSSRGCAIIPNKTDNNPKAEPNKLRKSTLLVSLWLSEALRATTSTCLFCIVVNTKHYLLFLIRPHHLQPNGCEHPVCHHWCHLPLRNKLD